jgi:hypothetical protein
MVINLCLSVHSQGRAVPTYASYIVDQNKRLVEAGATPINLKSIILGEHLPHSIGDM